MQGTVLSDCRLCPHRCGVDRTAGQTGVCGVADRPRLSGYFARRGEEHWISGTQGSGMLFFSGCTQACVFCQNFDINLELGGNDTTAEALAEHMLFLQEEGCHNIHWVTPTQQLPFALEALERARSRGLTLPLVYNTGGYESVETLRMLDGVVDVYLPDFKFWSEELAWRYLRVRHYPEVVREALLEMNRQVGDLVLDGAGLATRGLAVRHLVMPGCLEDAGHVFDWIAKTLGPRIQVNVMPFYEPVYRASRHETIARATLHEEWCQAMERATAAGLTNLYRYPNRPYPRHQNPVLAGFLPNPAFSVTGAAGES